MTPERAQAVVDGGYWLRPPEASTEVVVAYTGVVAPEAVAAVGRLAEARRGAGAPRRHLGRPAQRRLVGGAAGARGGRGRRARRMSSG